MADSVKEKAAIVTCGARIHDRDDDLRLLGVTRGLLGGDLVLVREPAEDPLSADQALSEAGRLWVAGCRLDRVRAGRGPGAAGRCCSAGGIRSAPGVSGAR